MSDLTSPPYLEYAHPGDDVAGAVVPTLVSGVAADLYPPANIGNQNPAFPFKTDSDTFRLVWDFGAPVTMASATLIHANLAAGLEGVLFEMNAADDWSAPSFSRAFTIPAYHEDDFPENAWLDLRDEAPSYRYASLAVTEANVVPCAIGELVLARTMRALEGTLQLDAEEDEDHPLTENRTTVGVSTINVHGVRWRWIRGDVTQTVVTAERLRSWNRATQGRGYPSLIWPHLDAADEPLYVRWEQGKLPRARIGPDGQSRFRLAWEEISRGLRPTPAAV
jgi:hypothetical protein